MELVNMIIGDGYMHRWGIKLASGRCLYLHHFSGDDEARLPHDHPKDFVTIGLWGSYTEACHEPGLEIHQLWQAPWVRRFAAEHTHRIYNVRNCWTLAYAGPARKAWGFVDTP